MLPAFSFPVNLDRSRNKEQLEASLAGLRELQILRQRQEYIVQEALHIAGSGRPEPGQLNWDLNGEESLYPSFRETGANSLRRYLNGLRRQEATLLTPLQQLERQVNDLRLEATQTSGGELEIDSRPSSAEPLHLDRDESLSYADSDYVSSVPRSFSTNRADSFEALMDVQPKYQCDLITRDGLDLFPYPSPLHAMAVQSPLLCQALRANSEEKPMSPTSYLSSYKLDDDGEIFFGSQGEMPLGLEAVHSKRLENYITGLVHKRIYPVRPNKLRTSLSTEATKGLIRQSSMCQRSTEAASPPIGACDPARSLSERRNIPSSHSFDGSLPSPKYRPQWTSSREQLSAKKTVPSCQSVDSFTAAIQQQKSVDEGQSSQQSLRKPIRLMANTPPMRPTSLEYHELNYHPAMRASPQENYYQNMYELSDRPQAFLDDRHQAFLDDRPQAFLDDRPQAFLDDRHQAFLSTRPESSELRSPSFDQTPRSEVSSQRSPGADDGGYQMVSAQYIPAQQSYKAHTASHGSKAKGPLMSKGRSVDASPEAGAPPGFREKGKASSKKCRFSEESEPAKRSGRRPSPRGKKTCRSQSENSLLNRHGVPCIKYNTVERDEVTGARPTRSRRHPNGCHRRWRSTAEISRDEGSAPPPSSVAYPQAEGRRRLKRYPKTPGHPGSDSEYPSRHRGPGGGGGEEEEEGEGEEGRAPGTRVYAANCFGDSESSLSEAQSPGLSSGSSDTDEEEEEATGLVWPQQLTPQAMGRESGQPKAFVKIKASHALKKKILRFRTGSLKVMTTV
ncbi:dapper 1-like isoform X2 [Stegostoma tigrinum]|uniref:dapper 1-like isoform X2 n=1 Tax=Stegostoma tigrinum TaxID=3053191 RepID=UPI0028709F24|nr:dapper 1-like isoform X2 [Stegostoma tigrinum]